jgi:hypothetical protein
VDDVNQFGRGRLGDLLSKELRRKSSASLHLFFVLFDFSLYYLSKLSVAGNIPNVP